MIKYIILGIISILAIQMITGYHQQEIYTEQSNIKFSDQCQNKWKTDLNWDWYEFRIIFITSCKITN